MSWTYRKQNVQVPRTADIPPQFWPRDTRGAIVQRVLDSVKPWQNGDDPIETMKFEDVRFMPIVVPLDGQEPWWGIHAGHHARVPKPSPFIRVDFDLLEKTNLFTIELEGTAHRPRLVRAYPGDYIPPLPWMSSARNADGGMKACLEFWRTHAYVFRRNAMRSRTGRVPDWFRN
jgi:hypothetical protein